MRRPAGQPADTSRADLRRSLRGILTVLSVLVLSAALPLYLVTDVPDSPRSEAWMLTLLVMVWAGIRLSLLWIAGAPRLFDFFFWLFTYIFMGMAPTAQIRSGLTSTTTPGVDVGLDVPTAAIVVLGVVCYEFVRAGWVARERRSRSRRRPVVRPVSHMRTAVLFGVALLLSAYVLSRLGVTVLLGSREAASAARIAAWPDPAVRSLIYASGVYPLLVAVGALAQLRRAGFTPTSRRLALIGAVLGSAVLLLIVNPVTSARYAFGTVAFALAVYLGAVATRRAARFTMLGTVIGFLFVFPLADTFRRASGASVTTRTGFFDEYLSNPDYDAFWQIANAFSYWVDGLVTPLSQFAGNLLFWVPRALWPGKPTDTGILLADYRGYAVDNLSAPLWAEALVNGGVVAVAIVFAILGWAFRSMDTRVVGALQHGGVWAIVGAILPVFTMILLRGSLLQATGALFLTVLCIVFVGGSMKRDGAGEGSAPPTSSALSPSRADVAGVGSIPRNGPA